MTSFALLFTLAAIGISETAYLIRKRIASEKPVCIIGESCAVVLSSKWNRIFGLHNDVAGLLFYLAVSFIAAFSVIGIEPVALWIKLLYVAVGIGAFFSVFLTYLQWRVIKAWCFWCVMSAITTWLMGIIVLLSLI